MEVEADAVEVVAAEEAATADRAKCTRQSAPSAVQSAKCRSSPPRAGRFIAVTASQSTGRPVKVI